MTGLREALIAGGILVWLMFAGALVEAKPRILERDFAMGEKIPWYLGVAWVDPYTGSRVLWPLGLNVLAVWGVDAYHWTRAKAERAWLHKLLREARTDSWSKGYADGRQELKRVQASAYQRGYDTAIADMQRRLAAPTPAYKGPERRASILQFTKREPTS